MGFPEDKTVFCRRGELGQAQVVGPGPRPILGNLSREGDKVTDFDGTKDGGRGRVDHDSSRGGLTIGIPVGEPECR